MEINFTQEHTVTLVPAKTATYTKIKILSIQDRPSDKTVTAVTDRLGVISLWSDLEYDAIGQWTDSDVAARIHQLYGN